MVLASNTFGGIRSWLVEIERVIMQIVQLTFSAQCLSETGDIFLRRRRVAIEMYYWSGSERAHWHDSQVSCRDKSWGSRSDTSGACWSLYKEENVMTTRSKTM